MLDPNITSSISDITKIAEVESIQEYTKWANNLPFFTFPADWDIKIVPPFGGAIVRFVVRRKFSKREVSVYLDCFSRLGSAPKPYWEIYPGIGEIDDTYRCYLDEIDDLISSIDRALGNKRIKLTKS